MVKTIPDKRNNQNEEDTMERDLAEDAVWKRIQKNTFTRWANEHLKTVNKHIENIDTDFEDGIRLVALVEVLSGKKLPPHNKKPKVRAQKLENVNIALSFLGKEEGIKLVNIDSIDVVDGRAKLILGLIWTLVIHYSISMPMWDGEDDAIYEPGKEPSPKQRLLAWIRGKIPDVQVNNFTTDWNDGKALGALVDALAPGLCPNWADWKPEDALKNVKEAMKLADEWLGIPQLIKSEDMINPKLDDLSMMTYLAQFPHAKLKPAAPIKPQTNPKRVRCYGSGIQPTGVVGGAKTNFTIETFSAGEGEVEVSVVNPDGKLEPVEVNFNSDRAKTYSCSYTPKMQGQHKVIVKFAGVEVPKCPFDVNVAGQPGDPSKVTVSGPGLEQTGVRVGKPTHFDICTKGAGLGQVEVVILDPHGKPNTVPMRIRQIEEHLYRCEYEAEETRVHSINVFFAGKAINKSPFGVRVAPPCDPRRVRPSGRGLQPTGVRIGDIADFRIFTDGAGEGEIEVKVIKPDEQLEKVTMKKISDLKYECEYAPTVEGKHTVVVNFAGQEIFRSPYEVLVGPPSNSKIRAYGPGLKGGVEKFSARFRVDTNGEVGTLGFTVEGPSEAKIECKDNGDGTVNVMYHPTAPGEYAIHVLTNGEDIPKSPWVVEIDPKPEVFFPEKVQVSGAGVMENGVFKGKSTEFTVNTKEAGNAILEATIMDLAYNEVPVNIKDNKDGTYKCDYKPEKTGRHVVQVNFGGVGAPNAPYNVVVTKPTDIKKVKISGYGVEPGVSANAISSFTVDASGAGPGDLKVSIKDDKNKEIPVEINSEYNKVYTVEYTAPAPGVYKIDVTYGGKKPPGYPLILPVSPPSDLSRVRLIGLEKEMFLNSPTDFTVDTRNLPKKSEPVIVCRITNPSGNKTDCVVTKAKDGTYKAAFTLLKEGPHIVDVLVDSQPVAGSPFTVNSVKGCNPKKAKAYGPGLEKGFTNQKNTFTIVTKASGVGPLGLSVEGPAEAKMICKDNRDGTYTVEYTPIEPGLYDIGIKMANKKIPGSPFKVKVEASGDANKAK